MTIPQIRRLVDSLKLKYADELESTASNPSPNDSATTLPTP